LKSKGDVRAALPVGRKTKKGSGTTKQQTETGGVNSQGTDKEESDQEEESDLEEESEREEGQLSVGEYKKLSIKNKRKYDSMEKRKLQTRKEQAEETSSDEEYLEQVLPKRKPVQVVVRKPGKFKVSELFVFTLIYLH